jgi:hypothetical protein
LLFKTIRTGVNNICAGGLFKVSEDGFNQFSDLHPTKDQIHGFLDHLSR